MAVPAWPGAEQCYSRAYALLSKWSIRNYTAAKAKHKGRGQCPCPLPSSEMAELIDALNRGDEEKIKGILLLGDDYHT